jgi:hypothetical protein
MSLTNEQFNWIDNAIFSYKEGLELVINERTGLVDVYFNGESKYLSLEDNNIETFPIPFGVIHGGFYFRGYNLRGLKNFPTEVKGYLHIENTKIRTLEHFPKKIDGDIIFRNNVELRVLYKIPSTVFGKLLIWDSPIYSLDNFPKKVYGDIQLRNTSLTSLEGLPPVIYENLTISGNYLKDLKIPYKIRCYGKVTIDYVSKFNVDDIDITFPEGYLGWVDVQSYIRTKKFIDDHKGELLEVFNKYPQYFEYNLIMNTGDYYIIEKQNISSIIMDYVLSMVNDPTLFDILRQEGLINNDNILDVVSFWPQCKIYL